jgi:serine protease Do
MLQLSQPARTEAPYRAARRKIIASVATAAALVFMIPDAFARGTPDGFSDIAKKVTPAVVNISTTSTRDVAQNNVVPFPNLPQGTPFDDMFRRFFQQPDEGDNGDDDNGAPTPAPRRGMQMTALGSGFIIDASGYVVTNNHVVARADKIQVTLSDGRKFDGRLIGRDEKTDLALVKVESDRPLPFVTFGDSEKSEVGDWVVAVGNPFGLGGTVTAGIISARGRDIEQGSLVDFLQIDASINRGNSGGPTFNMDGEVIGINTAIFSPSGGSVGIGFAIPSSEAKDVLAQLRDSGRIDRGYIGVQIQTITPELAQTLGLPDEKGALVAAVTPDSPAAKAGIRQGDVVTAVNGQSVTTLRDLPRLVANIKPDQTANMTVLREGKEHKLDVKIGAMPANEQMADARPSQPEPQQGVESSRVLGMTLATINNSVRQRFQLPQNVRGVLVTRVAPNSQAAEQGIRAGDIIEKVDNAAVTSPADVSSKITAARRADKPAVLVLVNRRGNSQYVALRTGQA